MQTDLNWNANVDAEYVQLFEKHDLTIVLSTAGVIIALILAYRMSVPILRGLLFCCVAVRDYYMRHTIRRGYMSARKKIINALLADIITDGIEDAVDTGKITEEESISLYRRVGHQTGLTDLIPKKLNEPLTPVQQDTLKDNIKGRLPVLHVYD